MPADSRMALDTILTSSTGRYTSPEAAPRPYPIRPSVFRAGTPQADPWDLPYPAAVRTHSAYSTYSLYSNASMDLSSSSSESGHPQTSIPPLSRHDSNSSMGASSPTTPADNLTEFSLPTHRYDEIAAGMALADMRTLSSSTKTVTLSPTLLSPTEVHQHPIQLPRRSSSPRTPRDVNGNRLYPCPLTAVYRCDQHFSTSGHARRHSRIHTGERSSECPECGQKFSRQDNMQQHRRTHRTGREKRTKSGSSGSSRSE